MPLYEYECANCGPFESMERMSDCAKPQECPVCDTLSSRVMLTAPSVSFVTQNIRIGHAKNERSADSPKRTSTHGPGCGCCSGGNKKNSKTLYRPDGSKSFPSKRPWMISH
jgi:putative FmdB family regulatory protein